MVSCQTIEIIVLSTDRRPDRCETGRAFSGKWLTSRSSETSLTRPLPLTSLKPRSSGVLERSDRKTDCFNGAIRHSNNWCSSSGQQFVGELPSQSTVRLRSHVMQQAGPPFKAVCELRPRQIAVRTTAVRRSASQTARHEKRTRPVGIRHGKSRRYE